MMNRIKAFPFWRKQYLFHPRATSNSTLLNLYHPYNRIAKLNWWLWKKFSFYQSTFTVRLNTDSKLQKVIDKFMDENPDYLWVINRGTKSIYQKTTGLMVSEKRDKSNQGFFFKWGDSKLAIESIKNEIIINDELKDQPFAPHMLQFQTNENGAFYTTEIIRGTKYACLDINADILKLIHEIQNIHASQAHNYCLTSDLKTSFHHGDFCPWNLILEDNTNIIKVIDWEFCGIYPKGFDLLYYIFSIEFQVKKHNIPENIINENYTLLNNYYQEIGITDWKPYLKEFAEICSKRYANTEEGDDFLKLLHYSEKKESIAYSH